MKKIRKKILILILLLTLTMPTITVYAENENSNNVLSTVKNTTDVITSITGHLVEPLKIANPALGIASTLKDALTGFAEGKLRNYLADNAMNGMCGWIMDVYGNAAISISDTFFNKFAPDISQFLNYIGSDELFNIFNSIGYTIALGIFVYMLIMIKAGTIRLAEVKDTPLQLVGGLIVSLTLIVNSRQIANIMFDITYSIWNDLLSKTGTDFSISDCIACIWVPTMLTNHLFNGDEVLMSIFTPILGAIFTIQFVKFMVEIAERYIVACLLYYSMGIASSTIVSKTTRSIFKKYFQMLMCQLLMLIFNVLFIILTCQMFTKAVVLQDGITGWIFIFAFLKVAQRVDNYLFTMGMSVAITGGNVLDSIVGASRALTGMARGMSGAAEGVGGVLKTGGSLAGLKAGMTLSNLAHPIKNAGNMGMTAEKVLQEASKRGSLANISKQITPGMVDSSLVNMAKSGNGALLNNLSTETKQEVARQAFGTEFMPEGSSLDNLSFTRDGGLNGSMSMVNADGSTMTSEFALSPESSNSDIRKITTEDGTDMFLTAKGNLEEGDVLSYKFDPDNPEAISMAEIATGTDFSKFGDERESIDHIVGGENGSSIIENSQNEILARTDKNGIAYNMGLSLNAADLKHLPTFSDLDDILIENAGNGKVYVRGTCGDYNSTIDAAPCREYVLTNRAIYPNRESIADENAKYVTRFGTNNSKTGSWNVGLKESNEEIFKSRDMYKRDVAKLSAARDLYIRASRNGSSFVEL